MSFEKSNWKAHWTPIYAYVVLSMCEPILNEGAYQVKDDD